MAIKDIFKVTRKTFFNPGAWFGDALMVNVSVTWNAVRHLFVTQKTGESETFAEAMARLQLSDADIAEQEQRFLLFALIFLVCTGVTLFYGFYLLFSVGSFSGFALAIAAAALFLAQAFRFHFWFFQIKFRKLGCTWKEWKQGKPDDQVPLV